MKRPSFRWINSLCNLPRLGPGELCTKQCAMVYNWANLRINSSHFFRKNVMFKMTSLCFTPVGQWISNLGSKTEFYKFIQQHRESQKSNGSSSFSLEKTVFLWYTMAMPDFRYTHGFLNPPLPRKIGLTLFQEDTVGQTTQKMIHFVPHMYTCM